MGDDPLDDDELPFVYEGRGPLAVPSHASRSAGRRSGTRSRQAGISWRRILHGEQSFSLPRPLPVEGASARQHRILAVDDKGAGPWRPDSYRADLFDAATGEPLAASAPPNFCATTEAAAALGSRGADAAARCPRAPSAQLRLSHVDSGGAALSSGEPGLHADPRRSRNRPQCGFRPADFAWAEYFRACLPRCLQSFAPRRPERLKLWLSFRRSRLSPAIRFVSSSSKRPRPPFPGDALERASWCWIAAKSSSAVRRFKRRPTSSISSPSPSIPRRFSFILRSARTVALRSAPRCFENSLSVR